MAERITKQTVIITREGKRIEPRIGAVFNYLPAEIKEIEAMAPAALGKLTEELDPQYESDAEREARELLQQEEHERLALEESNAKVEQEAAAQAAAKPAAKPVAKPVAKGDKAEGL